MPKQKFPAIFNLTFIKSAHHTLIGLSKTFRDKRQRRNFITLVLSLIIQGVPNLSQVNEISDQISGWGKRLSHFLKSSTWSNETGMKLYQSFIKKYLCNLQFVAIDWTALVKKGKCFELECTIYDSRDERVHDGFPLLLATGFDKAKKLWLPLGWQLASWNADDFSSENKITCNLIDQLASYLKSLSSRVKDKSYIFLMDRGFDRQPIIKQLLKHCLLFIIQTRDDKWVVLADDTKIKLNQLKWGSYQEVMICAWKLKLNVVVCGRGSKRRILLTNLDLNYHSTSEVREAFSTRGKIESNIKEVKQGFGLEKFQVRSFEAIKKLIDLIFLAYALTQITLTRFRKLLLWTRRKVLHLKTRAKRLTANLLRQILKRIIYFGLSDSLWLKLKQCKPKPP